MAVNILDFPFFTLKYNDGGFDCALPKGARRLSGGLFQQDGNTYALPDDAEMAALAEKTLSGKQLLSLLNRGAGKLFKEAPRLARGEECPMELCAAPAREGALRLTLHAFHRDKDWLLLDGLPRFRLCGKVIYEIIDDETLAEIFNNQTDADGNLSITLRGEDVPRFADSHGRLVLHFGDKKLKALLAEENLFIDAEKLTLVLCDIEGRVRPALRYDDRHYFAEDISARLDRDYVLLEDRWARREDIEAAGIFPLGAFAGGEPIEKYNFAAAESRLRNGESLAGLFSGAKAETRPREHVPAAREHVPAAREHVPTPREHVPTPREHVPMPREHVPMPREHVPMPREHVPTPREHVPSRGARFPFTFSVENKFSGLSGPALYSELGLLKIDGPAAPFVPLRLLKGGLSVERMDEEEKAFYLYWRGEFRRGNVLKTDEGYIRVYARELCLFAGGEGEHPEKDFHRLAALWENYAEIYPDINGFLPHWLMDFAAVYGITDAVLPVFVSCAHKAGDSLLTDIYLYRRFIEENNVIEYDDIKPLIRGADSKGDFYEKGSMGSQAVSALCLALNAVDRYLRENFRLKLFEFFYPPRYEAGKRTAFADMERSGRSSYSVCGPRFSKHFPLIDFLEKAAAYTEYLVRTKNGDKPSGAPPSLDDKWKRVVDDAMNCNFGMTETSLEKLRADSDAVHKLLAVEDKTVHTEAQAFTASKKPERKKISLDLFLKKLDKDDREVLRIITGVKNNDSLEAFAKKRDTMPALLIDRVNALFMELSGDLLICTVDEKPDIESEYKTELMKALKK
jgi:hypothetical protein